MYQGKSIALILPARNEAETLPWVMSMVPDAIDTILVIDNGSTDDTASVARRYGARVVCEPRPGYGRACLAGLAALENSPPDIVAFADADGSDDVGLLSGLLAPLVYGQADLALALRVPTCGNAMSMAQRIGNQLATKLIRIFWGHDYGDLGPMRAITWPALCGLKMCDPDFGWTIEMQIKAIKHGLQVREYKMPYGPRAGGKSKVSGTVAGCVRAGSKIMKVIGQEALSSVQGCRRGARLVP